MRKSATLLAIVVVTAGCQSEQIDRTMIVEPDMPVSYEADIQPIFDQNCAGSGCHIQSPTSGVRLSSYQFVIASRGAQYGRLIVEPGSAEDSPIIDKISSSDPENGLRMPFGRAALSATDIGLISKWIDEGAEDN
jgi:hypothetical protein